MQFESKCEENQTLNLILGKQKVKLIKNMSLLLVGAGGIGCQVLKNLYKIPFKKITVVDLDIIQISNLNRQFYFRKQHIGQSKAEVVKIQIKKMCPQLNIEAIEGSIYDKIFDNWTFYHQFDFIISALDNLKARQYLAKQATKYNKILIDAGTSGFFGQSYSTMRFLTSCHNCNPSVQQQNFAICSIRNRPQKSIHCAIYAKNIYQQFFGAERDDFLSQKLKLIKKKIKKKDIFENYQKVYMFGKQIFDYLFNDQLQNEQQNNFTGHLNLITFDQALKLNKIEITVKKNSQNLSFQKSYHSWSNQLNVDTKIIDDEQIGNIYKYTQTFIRCFIHLVRRERNLMINESRTHGQNKKIDYQIINSLIYDKDDLVCTLFVYCITNLRICNFKDMHFSNQQPQFKTPKMKYMTFYQCRNIIGKVIPAIASTNSIAASLQVKQIYDLLQNTQINYKYFTISPLIQQKISSSWISKPNPQCKVCSPNILYFQIQCSLYSTTFQQLQQFAQQNCYLKGRDIYCQNFILVKNFNTKIVSKNKPKYLNFKKDLINRNTLTLQFLPLKNVSDLKVQVTLINTPQQLLSGNKFKILNKTQIQETLKRLRQIENNKQIENFADIEINQAMDLA